MEKLDIFYYKLEEKPTRKENFNKRPEAIVRELPDIKKEEIEKPPKVLPKKVKSPQVNVRRVESIKEAKQKKFEKVVEEEPDDAKKATYISYYRAVREKIKQWADRNYPRHRDLGEGEIFLTFVVASSGELLHAKLVHERSANNDILKNIAIKSIRNSSPFPPFPKGMNQYQITFNVAISFELNK